MCFRTMNNRACSRCFQVKLLQTAASFQHARTQMLPCTRHYSSCANNLIEVERDVRYSSCHPRNVLDIYSPKGMSKETVPTLLFVHGGMWLRGSKEQSTLSMHDMMSHVASQAYQTLLRDSPSPDTAATNDKIHSNLGLYVAQHGGIACIMNYRLAGSDRVGETGHPHQVMDVARAIAFLTSKCIIEAPLHLYVGGHSAGAHLAALVLSDPQYLRMAMQERALDYDLIRKVLRGYVGISGVYNLRRLAMSPLAAVTIGPAFRGKEDCDVTLDASPVQVLLHAHNSIQKDHENNEHSLPSLVSVPLLLLNAESDFHLAQDTLELLTALNHFSVSVPADELPARQSIIVPNSNHLSIMGEFGRGLMNVNEFDAFSPDDKSWTVANVFRRSRDALFSASAFMSPYVVSDATEEADEASMALLEFMRLK